MDMQNVEQNRRNELLTMTAEVVSAYASNNLLAPTQLSDVINTVFSAFAGIEKTGGGEKAEALRPAVTIRKSITPDYIVCLEDGKKLKMLKLHLRSTYNMTPDEYRAKWGLPPDYPMVAPNYAAQRSAFAKQIGLGRKTGQKVTRRPRKQ
jgi:predicted transcriptional regulator